MRLLSSLLGHPQAFALDFSDAAIQLLEISGKKDGMRATSYARVELPAGLIDDGAILDQKAVAEKIQALVAAAKSQPPQTARAVCALPESRIFIHHFSIPAAADAKDLPDAVRAEAEATMPFDVDAYAWDFQILSKSGDAYETLFAAAPADLAVSYEQTLLLAGLELVALEPESLALARALPAAETAAEKQGAAIVDMGGRGTHFVFVDADGIRLSVSRPEGGDLLTETIAKKLKIPPEQAEKRKREKGMKDAKLDPIVREIIKPVIEEFDRARGFYEETHDRKVAKAIFVGGSSRLPGLRDYLAQAWKLEIADILLPLGIPNVEPENAADVIGLALRASHLTSGISFISPY